MNRNVESHFSELPSASIERSTFDRSSSYKTSFNVGDIIPFYVDEVLPGDTFDITTAKVVRSQTMLSPVMDNIFLDTYYFFVPNRIVWEHWKEFCGENSSGPWAPSVDYRIPTISAPSGGFKPGTIADYMGLPVNVEWSADYELAPTALPFRAYALICNEFFRDQNLSDPLLIPKDDANQTGTNNGNYVSDVANGGLPFKASKYHDYFTSCLPAPQKGEPVGIPITVPGFQGGVFPVTTSAAYKKDSRFYPLVLSESTFDTQTWTNSYGVQSVTRDKSAMLSSFDDSDPLQHLTAYSADNINSRKYAPANLVTNIPSQAESAATEVSFNINELRLAFAYQRFLEALARGGSRYTELVLSLFGVRSPDARLQRPEYLGGNRIPINVNEVTNSTQLEADGMMLTSYLGDLAGKSQTGDVNHDFVKSFTEHGYLIGVMVARYDHSYAQGIQRFWTRKVFSDFYNPKFAHLGEVPVYQAEIYAYNNGAENNLNKSAVFGYQEIWADYRYRPNMVTGEMRPNISNSLSWWHLADSYETTPYLSDGWIREDKTNVDRVLAVTSQVSNQFWCDIYIRNKCTRCMPMYSVPGLIDHF